MTNFKCQKCGGNNGWLERVNEKGVPGIWECRPNCETIHTREEAIAAALENKS